MEMPAAASRPIPVLIVTAPDCHFCAELKVMLGLFAIEYPIEVEEVPLDSPRGWELAGSSAILFPPGLFINGEFLGYGRPSYKRIHRRLVQLVLESTAVPAR